MATNVTIIKLPDGRVIRCVRIDPEPEVEATPQPQPAPEATVEPAAAKPQRRKRK